MNDLAQACRDARVAVLTTITRRPGGDVALAEDAVHGAFVGDRAVGQPGRAGGTGMLPA